MSEFPQVIDEISLKLTSKGYYIWSITLAGSDNSTALRLQALDARLKDLFPNHAKPGTARSTKFDSFDE